MKKSDFYFELPKEMIAQDPLKDRSASKLMVLDKNTGEIQHKCFKDILSYLKKGDCLVLNDTKVIPARLIGKRNESGGVVEILLLKRLPDDEWECLVRPGKKLRVGAEAVFGDGKLKARVEKVLDDGNRIVKFFYDGIWEEVLDSLGEMPLPPYITHKLQDKNRYQTVYAKNDGSAAAPTAGLHFTKELLQEVEAMGVKLAKVTLHVGLGTFRPVKEDEILNHHMHTESYQVSKEAADIINETRANGGRVICVGTTSCRTIESAACFVSADGNVYDRKEYAELIENNSAAVSQGEWKLFAGSGDTDIFIYPGYSFKLLDCLVTNFHLPESTLIMLVSALSTREKVLAAYKEAVANNYRFFSFGDAMFVC